MRISTRRRNQLNTVKDWLKKARPEIETNYVTTHGKDNGVFTLLIACEQLLDYCEKLEESIRNETLNT